MKLLFIPQRIRDKIINENCTKQKDIYDFTISEQLKTLPSYLSESKIFYGVLEERQKNFRNWVRDNFKKIPLSERRGITTLLNMMSFASVNRGTFDPPDSANLQAWYDASNLSDITKDGSNRVSQWNDRNGSGRNLVQCTAGNQPLWVSADQNGLDVIDTSGSRWMSTSAWTELAVPNMILGAVKLQTNDAASHTYVDGIANLKFHLFENTPTDDQFGLYAGTDLLRTQAGLKGAWKYFTALFDASVGYIRINGTQLGATAGTGSQGMTGLTMGCLYDQSRMANTKFGEIFVYSVALSDADRTTVEDRLARWI